MCIRDRFIIDPIINVEHVYFKDIVGYEAQKKKLIENTEAFISGKEANNVLLFGDAGTGKSSSVKAILNEYYGQGLRMIEVLSLIHISLHKWFFLDNNSYFLQGLVFLEDPAVNTYFSGHRLSLPSPDLRELSDRCRGLFLIH